MPSAPSSSSARTGRVTRFILIAIALVGLAVMAWKLSEVFTIAFGGIVGAALLRALALPLTRHSHLSEKVSLTLVIVGLLIAAGLVGWLFGTQVAEQANEMQRLIPEAVHQLTVALNSSAAGQSVVRMTKQALGDSKMISGVGLAAGSLLFGVADMLLVFFLSIYLAFSPREYLDGLVRLFPVKQRSRVKSAFLAAGDALRRWLLAQFIAMGAIGILVGVAMGIMGVPLAFLLGTLAAVLEFIPVVGAVLFTLPGVLIAFTQGPSMALYVLLAYIGVQQLESNLVVPLLQRWAVRLPPAITLLSVVIGGVLFGAPGLVFASPLAVVAMTLIRTLYIENTLEHGQPAMGSPD